MNNDFRESEKIEKLFQFINKISVGMLVTVDDMGSLKSRPMGTVKVDGDGHIWFFTDEYSEKAADVEENHVVNVSYADKESSTYVSIAGKARVVYDKVVIDELWNPAYKVWFPDGKSTPGLALLEVVPDSGEIWDNSSSKTVFLLSALKAFLTGTWYNEGVNYAVKL